ncbi:MAG: hypothetical protein ACYC27_03685 [Armatimonadota bacterium]
MDNNTVDEITTHLTPLIGLKLSIARRAANMRVLHFGDIRPVENETVGEYALHIQCPWRIEGPKGIITGSSDLWKPVSDEGIDYDTWDYDTSENVQDRQIGILLGEYVSTRSSINTGDKLIVESVDADVYGGSVISLSGGYRIVMFPAGTRSEDWRIFVPKTDDPHFVVVGGKVEE